MTSRGGRGQDADPNCAGPKGRERKNPEVRKERHGDSEGMPRVRRVGSIGYQTAKITVKESEKGGKPHAHPTHCCAVFAAGRALTPSLSARSCFERNAS